MTCTSKRRTLYSVRCYCTGHVIGTAIRHKARLVPLRTARRIERCLRRSGPDAQLASMVVRLTPGQAEHLAWRYG